MSSNTKTLMKAGSFRISVKFDTDDFPLGQLTNAIKRACNPTAKKVAENLVAYMIARFSEPKSGRRYFIFKNGRWTTYVASAPTEYPAIKYGILASTLRVSTSKHLPGGFYTEFGVSNKVTRGGFSAAQIAEANNYAMELEGIDDDGPKRPFFERTRRETEATREAVVGKLYREFIEAEFKKGFKRWQNKPLTK